MEEKVMEKKRDAASRLNGVAQDFVRFAGEEFADDFSYFSEKTEENVISLLDVGKPR